MFHIFSPYFLQVFFQFSPTFPNDKNDMFPWPVNKCLQEHCEGQSRFLLEWILAVPKDILAARLLRQPILHLLCHCPWNISYMTLDACTKWWDVLSTFFSWLQSMKPLTATENAKKVDDKKRKAQKLYMTQPLRQNVAIWIVVICVLEAGPHLFHLFPSSILQSEGLWQHKGLGKHNTISVASSILTCNGLATQKRLASWR